MKKIILNMVLGVFVLGTSQLFGMETIINGERWVSVPTQNANEAGKINSLVSDLTEQLTSNRNFKNISDNRIAVTSFVALNDFSKATKIGNIISEDLLHELQVRGYTVVDFKTMDTISVKESGDFIFSRDTEKLRKKYNINLVLSGTCTNYKKGTVVNARIIDMTDHSIVSSAQIWIPKRLTNKIIGVNSIIKPRFIERKTIPEVSPYNVKITH